MTSDLYYLIYASAAAYEMDDAELLELLRQARNNNEALGVTGLLLYRNGNFMQLLEGEQEKVQQLFRKVERDPRHYGVMILSEGELDRRRFDAWAMAFKNLGKDPLRSEPGYSSFLETLPSPEDAEVQGDRLLLLLDTFRGEML
jgi:hypothetical protein